MGRSQVSMIAQLVPSAASQLLPSAANLRPAAAYQRLSQLWRNGQETASDVVEAMVSAVRPRRAEKKTKGDADSDEDDLDLAVEMVAASEFKGRDIAIGTKLRARSCLPQELSFEVPETVEPHPEHGSVIRVDGPLGPVLVPVPKNVPPGKRCSVYLGPRDAYWVNVPENVK